MIATTADQMEVAANSLQRAIERYRIATEMLESLGGVHGLLVTELGAEERAALDRGNAIEEMERIISELQSLYQVVSGS